MSSQSWKTDFFENLHHTMLEVILPDGSKKAFEQSVTPMDVAADIGPGLAKATLAGEVDGNVIGFDTPLPNQGQVNLRLLTNKDQEALGVMRHSCAHIMARAVMRLFDGVQLAFGPTIEGGFYYDFDLEHKLSEDDFPAIEAEMKKIIKANEPFERIERDRDQSLKLVEDLGQKYKIEHIGTGLKEHSSLSFYQQGEFIDLCRGPHIPKPKAIGAYKLLSVAGAYWKGDSSNRQLQRVYATAFFNKEDMEAHLAKIEEAKRRDHRVLGRQLDLFSINPMVGQGLILWSPKGTIIRNLLTEFVGEQLKKYEYLPVVTPNIGKVDLYKTSGHYPYYKDSQFAPITQAEDEQYLLKPMNCPHHIMIYKSEMRSYRDLPVRYAEFGTVYRYEQSGELNGLTRVRGFTVDDAHLFVRDDQLLDEFKKVVTLIQYVFNTLGLSDFQARVGKRDPNSDKYVGDPEKWDKATEAIIEACEDLNLRYTVEEGEAAFYGPKLDFIVRDVLKREWQLGTVQVDYNLPERFDLEYTTSDNERERPVMIHRAPFGSIERFTGILIEHFYGAFPAWLAPEQVVIIPITDNHEEYADSVRDRLAARGVRVHVDKGKSRMGGKIRNARGMNIPYILIVGDAERDANSVAVRLRTDEDLGVMTVADFETMLMEVIDKKSLELTPTPAEA